MNSFALIFLASVVVFLQFNQLAPYWLLVLAGIAVATRVWFPACQARLLLSAALAGVMLVQLTFWIQLPHRLSAQNQGVIVKLRGQVTGIPVLDGRRTQFLLDVESWQSDSAPRNVQRLSLNWYGKHRKLMRPGQRWQLRVKLKSPRQFANPGAFDYSGWLFRQRIHAIGYVVTGADNRLLSTSSSLSATRIKLSQRLAEDAGDASYIGLMQALLVGLRSNVSDQTWALLRATGTSHLLAISGLHIGMLAAWGFSVGCLLWSITLLVQHRIAGRNDSLSELDRSGGQRLNRMDCAALLSLFAALGYACLAGFTLPTQRALIMLLVLMLVRLVRRHADSCTPISLALVIILVVDPLAPLSAGFWLSFAAVLILLGIGSRFATTDSIWKRALLTHVFMGLLMFPLTALFFGQSSVVAPLANLIAIPYVSVLVVPPLMLWLLLSPVSGLLGHYLLGWTQFALSLLIDALYLLQRWLPAEVSLGSISPLSFGTMLCATLLLVLPGIPHQRWLIVPLVLPFCWNQLFPVASDQLTVTVLDVGAGMAIVVRTAGHSVLYGTGGRTPAGHSRARSVLLPYSRAAGIRRLDDLIVPDSTLVADELLPELRERLDVVNIRDNCESPTHWRADQTVFSLYAVESALVPSGESCIMLIRHGDNTIILADGVDTENFQPLRQRIRILSGMGETPADSAVSLLVIRPAGVLAKESAKAPVKGPVNSSGLSGSKPGLVTNVQHLVFSGVQRYGDEFAHEVAQMRYKIRGVTTYGTDRSGAISFSFSRDGLLGSPSHYRQQSRRAWHGSPG